MAQNLFSKEQVKKILKKYSIFPSKKLGQNFLINKFFIKKIVKAANLSQKDIVLEIGPGIGNLTQEIAKKAKKVIAIEKDLKMIEILKENLKNFKNIEIIFADIRKIIKNNLKIKNSYKVVANLPFYLSTCVIRMFLEKDFPPKEMVLILQKEVAQRICTKPPNMNLLAVSVQLYAKAKIIDHIPKKCFWPQPKVDSAIIKISNVNQKLNINKKLFFKIVKAGFSQPRKTLANNLSKKLNIKKEKIKEILKENNISFSQRAGNLSVQDWKNITNYFSTDFLL